MRPLTREDRQAILAHLAGLGPRQSELTFTNLFIWRDAYQLRVAEVAGALANLEALGVTGGCIEVEGAVEAFTLGELLNPDTVVIHIEKANAAFHGLYQVINQQFLEREWANVRYVNREQDLGVSGLRRAKESYYPHHMVEKFVVILR